MLVETPNDCIIWVLPRILIGYFFGWFRLRHVRGGLLMPEGLIFYFLGIKKAVSKVDSNVISMLACSLSIEGGEE